MRISLKAINSELVRLGSNALLSKGDGYFYFSGGEAADWLDTRRPARLISISARQRGMGAPCCSAHPVCQR